MREEKKTDQLETPPWLFNHFNRIFRFTIDACASNANAMLNRRWTLDDNCLLKNWSDEIVWLNPPYSNPGPFLAKAPEAYACVALVKGDPSTQWWQEHVENKACMIWLPKRVKFYLGRKPTIHAASFPSVALLYGITPRM